MKKRVAFDLDETLGIPIVDGASIVGFQDREGAIQLLEELYCKYSLLLWTVSNRNYLEKILSFGLKQYFVETYSWDEMPVTWKDIRKIRAEYLVDDSDHHRIQAEKHGIENGYIVVVPYGVAEDRNDPLLWVRQIEEVLFK
jgi:hypothetical protein